MAPTNNNRPYSPRPHFPRPAGGGGFAGRKRFFVKPTDPLTLKYKRNEDIQSPVLFVITEEGDKLGEMSKLAAIQLAKEKNLDLVELSPGATPPVAKIISWSKFKYDQDKKKKANKNSSQEQKEIWFKAFIGDGDIDHKLKRALEFIDKKHTVKLTVKQRGRRVNDEMIISLMKRLTEKCAEFAKIIQESKKNGNQYSMIIGPK